MRFQHLATRVGRRTLLRLPFSQGDWMQDVYLISKAEFRYDALVSNAGFHAMQDRRDSTEGPGFLVSQCWRRRG